MKSRRKVVRVVTVASTCQLISVLRPAHGFREQPANHAAQVAKQLETGANFRRYPRQSCVRSSVFRLHVTLHVSRRELHVVDRPRHASNHAKRHIYEFLLTKVPLKIFHPDDSSVRARSKGPRELLRGRRRSKSDRSLVIYE